MSIFRTRFKGEIVAEYLPPARARKKQKVVIFCQGAPSVPNARRVLEHFSKKGYWAFFPRYRGAWESDGTFMKHSPHQDILEVIEEMEKGFLNLWTGAEERVVPDEVHLIGASFGGAAVLMASHHPKVTKVVALSPVVDWLDGESIEPIERMYAFSKVAFGNGYRWSKNAVEKIRKGTFYNPANNQTLIAPEKVFILHNKDDVVVHYTPSERLAKALGIKLSLKKQGGHYGTSAVLIPGVLKQVEKFLKGK